MVSVFGEEQGAALPELAPRLRLNYRRGCLAAGGQAMGNAELPGWWLTLVGLLPATWQPHATLIYAGLVGGGGLIAGVYYLLARREEARRKRHEADAAHFVAIKAQKESEQVGADQRPMTRKVADAVTALRTAKDLTPELQDAVVQWITKELTGPGASDAAENFVKQDVAALVNSTESEERRALALIAEHKPEEAAAALLKEARSMSKESADRFARVGRLFYHRSVKDAIDAFEIAVKLDPTDIDSRIRLSKLYARTGRTSESREGLERAVKDAERPVDLTEALVSLAERLFWSGGVNDANAVAERAINQANEWARKGERAALEKLAYAYMIAGRISLKRGDYPVALERMKAGIKVAREIGGQSGDSDAQLLLVEMLSRGSEAWIRNEQPGEAVKVTEEALAAARAIIQTRQSPEAQRGLSIALRYASDAYRAANRTEEAMKLLREELEINKARCAADAGDGWAARDLMVNHSRLGDLENEAQHWEAAAGHLNEVVRICRQRAHDDPLDSEAQRDLSLSLIRIGDWHAERDKRDLAAQVYEDVLKIDRGRHNNDPEDRDAMAVLTTSLLRMSDFVEDERALALAQEAASLCVRLPVSADSTSKIAIAYTRIGDLMEKQQKFEEAELSWRQAAQVARAYVDTHANSNGCHEDLAIAIGRLAGCEERRKAPQKAAALYREASATVQALCAAEPERGRWKELRDWYDQQAKRVSSA